MGKGLLPPGFRFHPTDVELVRYYLRRKVLGKKFLFDAIGDIDIYDFNPWELTEKSRLRTGDLKWYFFCPREKKYATGGRMKRATEFGYWKTTGRDRAVSYKDEVAGMIKTLVFHTGKAPKGDRTDWVMYEYRLEEKGLAKIGIMQDSYVLCVIFKKDGPGPKNGAQYGAPFNEDDWNDDDDGGEQEVPGALSLGGKSFVLPTQQRTSPQVPGSVCNASSPSCPSMDLPSTTLALGRVCNNDFSREISPHANVGGEANSGIASPSADADVCEPAPVLPVEPTSCSFTRSSMPCEERLQFANGPPSSMPCEERHLFANGPLSSMPCEERLQFANGPLATVSGANAPCSDACEPSPIVSDAVATCVVAPQVELGASRVETPHVELDPSRVETPQVELDDDHDILAMLASFSEEHDMSEMFDYTNASEGDPLCIFNDLEDLSAGILTDNGQFIELMDLDGPLLNFADGQPELRLWPPI